LTVEEDEQYKVEVKEKIVTMKWRWKRRNGCEGKEENNDMVVMGMIRKIK
jgi:hypothetical protein